MAGVVQLLKSAVTPFALINDGVKAASYVSKIAAHPLQVRALTLHASASLKDTQLMMSNWKYLSSLSTADFSYHKRLLDTHLTLFSHTELWKDSKQGAEMITLLQSRAPIRGLHVVSMLRHSDTHFNNLRTLLQLLLPHLDTLHVEWKGERNAVECISAIQ